MSLYATDLFYSINTEKWNSWPKSMSFLILRAKAYMENLGLPFSSSSLYSIAPHLPMVKVITLCFGVSDQKACGFSSKF